MLGDSCVHLFFTSKRIYELLSFQSTTDLLLHCRDCEEGCLDGDSVKGKIVLCDSLAGDRGAYKAGALGSVLMNEVGYNVSLVPLLASTALMREEYNVVRSYTNSTRYRFFWTLKRQLCHHIFSLEMIECFCCFIEILKQTYLKAKVIKDPAAPTVAYFSSHGPNIILPDIIQVNVSFHLLLYITYISRIQS